jgi:hypothetical protein
MSQGEGGGRPPRWETEAELQASIDGYFAKCEADNTPPGIYGLVDFTTQSISTFYEYESGKKDTETEKFSIAISKARLKVVAFAESRVYQNTAGAVSQLVNTTRKYPEPYKNSQAHEVTGPNSGPLQIVITPTQSAIV